MERILRILSAALLVVWGNLGVCAGVGHPTFLSPQASPIARVDGFVFVANTPADTVDVIQARSLASLHQDGVVSSNIRLQPFANFANGGCPSSV
jgi:hypothetical protein